MLESNYRLIFFLPIVRKFRKALLNPLEKHKLIDKRQYEFRQMLQGWSFVTYSALTFLKQVYLQYSQIYVHPQWFKTGTIISALVEFYRRVNKIPLALVGYKQYKYFFRPNSSNSNGLQWENWFYSNNSYNQSMQFSLKVKQISEVHHILNSIKTDTTGVDEISPQMLQYCKCLFGKGSFSKPVENIDRTTVNQNYLMPFALLAFYQRRQRFFKGFLYNQR